MDIEKMTKDIGKAFAKIFLNKEEKSSKKLELSQMSSADIVSIMVNRLLHEGEYNKAENMLFDELNKNNSYEVYQVAVEFYNSLLDKSDEELCTGNFSREEVYQGLEDINKLISVDEEKYEV